MRSQMQQGASLTSIDVEAKVGRRGAPRLRLSIPAQFISLYGTFRCILIDLSCSGAQLGFAEPLDKGETGFLHIGGLEVFCEVVREAKGPNGGMNGLLFDPELANADVLQVRHFAEQYAEHELRRLRSEVKDWVNGTFG
ncbi:MAG: PilZ domain-containing protein [Pseudomonadota bacterium]